MMHNSQLLDKYRLSLPLSKSVRARELVLDALNGREIEIEDENDDIFVLSRALYNAQLSGIILDLKASGTDRKSVV